MARRVLADYWIDQGDADRGLFVQASCEGLVAHCHALLAEHGLHWFEPLWAAGFASDRVELDRGFLRPLAILANDPLATHPQVYRISPIVYRLEQRLQIETLAETWRATRWSAAGFLGFATIRIRESRSAQIDPLMREHEILERFDHPAIPRVSDLAQTPRGTALVFDYAAHPLPATLPMSEVIALGRDVAHGLAAVHARDVIHAWLMPSRIVLADHPLIEGLADARCDLAPVDFGYGTFDPRHRPYNYLAREQVLGRKQTPAVDIWALAMILIELAQNAPVVATRATDFGTLQAIRDRDFDLRISHTPLGAVLGRAIADDPLHRPSAAALAQELASLL